MVCVATVVVSRILFVGPPLLGDLFDGDCSYVGTALVAVRLCIVAQMDGIEVQVLSPVLHSPRRYAHRGSWCVDCE